MAELTVPRVDFSALGDLPGIYKQAVKERTLADLGKGLADGTLDYKQAGAKLASLGDLSTGLSLIKLGEQQKAGKEGQLLIDQLYGAQPAAPAASTPSAPTANSSDPRGIRNNNPLNLEASPFTQNQPGFTGSDGRFGRFETPEQGFAAADKLLAGYGQRGINSISGIINRWAPGTDGNNVSAYAAHVAQRVGIDPNQPINLADPAVRAKILPAMAEFENGRPVQVASLNGAPTPDTAPAVQPAGAQVAQATRVPTSGSAADPGGLQISPRIQQLMRAVANPMMPEGQKEVFKTLLQRELDNSKLPDPVKQYLFAKGQGYDGSFVDYQTQIRKAGATNIDQRAEAGEEKAAGEAAGKRRAEMFAAAGSAGKTLTNLSRMEGMLNQVAQGKLSPARMNISAWAKSLGLNDDVAQSLGLDPKGVGSAQAVQSLINESVVGKIGQGGFPANNFSDADREFITRIFPSLGDDPRANKIRIEGARRMAQLDIERAKAFQAFKRDPANKGRGFEDFELDWSDKVAKRDVFGDLRREAESIIGAPRNDIGGTLNSPAAQPQTAPQRPSAAPRAGAIEDGYRFMGGDPSKQENWEPVR